MGAHHSRTADEDEGSTEASNHAACDGNPLKSRPPARSVDKSPTETGEKSQSDHVTLDQSRSGVCDETVNSESKTEQTRLGLTVHSQHELSTLRSANSVSRVSSLGEPRPQVTVEQAKAILHRIFDPPPGELECIASGFLRCEQFRTVGTFLSAFLHVEQREKWYLDAVMLAVLGKDRWRSAKHNDLINMSIAPSREQIRRLNQQRREYTNQLRERLLIVSGAVTDNGPRQRKASLQSLLRTYRNFKAAEVKEKPTPASPERGRTTEQPFALAEFDSLSSSASRDFKPPHTDAATVPAETEDNLYITRLRTTVATSFQCFTLLSNCVPSAVLSTLPTDYFLNSTPVLDDRIAFKEKKVGDLAGRSFFVTLAQRVDLLRGVVRDRDGRVLVTVDGAEVDGPCAPCTSSTPRVDPATSDLLTVYRLMMTNNGNGNGNGGGGGGNVGSGSGGYNGADVIRSPDELVMAMKHLGLILTTACSSMVLDVLFRLAEVIKVRRCFRALSQDAASRGLRVEDITGEASPSQSRAAGSAGESEERQWKQLAGHDEMSLTVYTRKLIQHYRTTHAAKIDKLRKTYCNLFAYFETIAPEEEGKCFDVTRLLSGIVLKLMFLIGGGQRSIEADDRRVPLSVRQVTDDILISRMLEVPVLSRICWVACMMGMPVMTLYATAKQDRGVKPLTFAEADECAGIMRELFQAVGALPWGSHCPRRFTEWLPLFPLYAVDTEGKRILLYLYTVHSSAIRPLNLTLQKDMVLLSFAEALKRSTSSGRVDVTSYFFQPHFTVGYREDDSHTVSANGASSSAHTVTSASYTPSPPTWNEPPTRRHAQRDAAAAADTPSWGDERGPQPKRRAQELSGSGDRNAAQEPAARRVAEPHHDHAVGRRDGLQQQIRNTSDNDDDNDGASSSSTASAFSTESALLPDDADIDIYTCVSRQNQLYLRCSNEATVRRHRSTELTPFVTVEVLNSTKSLLKLYPEMARRVLATAPALLPGERFIRLRWNRGEPCVTLCVGDYLPVTVERVSPAGGARYFNQQQQQQQQAPASLALHSAGNGGDEGGVAGLCHATLPVTPPRGRRATRSSVVFTTTDAPPVGAGAKEAHPEVPQAERAVAADAMRDDGAPAMHGHGGTRQPQGAGRGAHGDGASGGATSRRSSSGAGQPALNELASAAARGRTAATEHRIGARWTILQIIPCRSVATGASTMGGGSSGLPDPGAGGRRGGDVVLLVSSPDLLTREHLQVVSIGHERSSMSAFRFLGDRDDVCWANPHLLTTILGGSTVSDAGIGGAGEALTPKSREMGSRPVTADMLTSVLSLPSVHSPQVAAAGRSAALCKSQGELHDVFYAIGVLLSNTIANGVFLSIPLAPLFFYLMKKALATGDYTFKNFMWLEPSDGNLLSASAVLNAAYGVLTLSDTEYIRFLHTRGLTRPRDLVFPVLQSIAAESATLLCGDARNNSSSAAAVATGRSDLASFSASTPFKAMPVVGHRGSYPSSMAPQSTTGGGEGRSERMLTVSEIDALTVTPARRNSRGAPSSQVYLAAIHRHNLSGSMFRGSATTLMEERGEVGSPVAYPHSPNAARRLTASVDGDGEDESLMGDAQGMSALRELLPSREEYITLYLVNEIAWSSVQKDGKNGQTKDLWVTMGRGLMSSPLAKSPLFTHCCSRVIREVLCVPPK